MQREIVCFYCLGDAELRFDKRSRPYTRCALCGSRAFMPTRQSLVGFPVAQDIVRASRDMMRTDRAHAESCTATTAAFLGSLREALAEPALALSPVATAPAINTPATPAASTGT
jgi:hypothetical protein